MKVYDFSQWQGNINWAAVDSEIVILKMSGGDAGLYYDSKASINYIQAKANGKAVGGYHFAGGTNPIAEADFFIRAMSPLAENDVLVLDWEVSHPDPVGWCKQFIDHVHAQTGVWCIIYMNTSTCNAHDWSPVFTNSGLWIADYRYTPQQDVPCHHPYIMHQYTSGGSCPGVAGRVDVSEWFSDFATFNKYGYHAPVPTPPTPEPTPPPVVTPPAPEPVPEPVPTPEPTPPVEPPVLPPAPTPVPHPSIWEWFALFFKYILSKFKKG